MRIHARGQPQLREFGDRAFGRVAIGFQPVSRASLMDMYIVILRASLERGRVSS